VQRCRPSRFWIAYEIRGVDFLLHIIPDTAVGAFASGGILQVLLFSVLFGIGLALMGERSKPLCGLIRQISGVIFNIVHGAGVGVFDLISCHDERIYFACSGLSSS
jgi:Na+/H+-dicarboxylate symporter